MSLDVFTLDRKGTIDPGSFKSNLVYCPGIVNLRHGNGLNQVAFRSCAEGVL